MMPELQVQCDATIGSLHIDAAFTATQPWTVLFGPSGSGKSSLLRLIAGLWQPENSRVLVGTYDVTRTAPYLRRVSLVAQEPALFPHRNARENVCFGMPGEVAKALLADKLLKRLHVPHVATQRPHQLSGGEIKRVAIARALAMSPRLLLLDEVFTGMGSSLAAELRVELRVWQKETNVPILSVTHDLSEALEADEVIRIDAGRITAQGAPRTVLSSERDAMAKTLTGRETL